MRDVGARIVPHEPKYYLCKLRVLRVWSIEQVWSRKKRCP